MKKRLTVLLTTMLMLCSCVCPLFVFAVDTDAPEFDIENGVLVRYNGADSDVTVEKGIAQFETPVLENYDDYSFTLKYAGNDNFTSSQVSGTFHSTKVTTYGLNIIPMNITVGDDEIITVVVPKHVDDVVIWVNGIKYRNHSFTGNNVTFNVTGLKEGLYYVTATVNDTEFDHKNFTTLFTVSKIYPTVNITVVNETSLLVGDKVTVIVSVPEDVTENVTIMINGMEFSKKPVNGNATFEIENITAGDKTITAVYYGDDKYRFNSTAANFTVLKRELNIEVTVNDTIYVGENATVKVVLSRNATGYAVVNVGGNNYTITLVNSSGSVVIAGLKNETYEVKVTYIGDDQYAPQINNTQSIKVMKVASSINLTVSESGIITNGSDVNITIKAPVITGKVNVTLYKGTQIINSYIVFVNEGTGLLTIASPDVGFYNVTAKYLENDKYLASENKTSFEVYGTAGELTVTAPDVYVNDTNAITVTVAGNHTGNVTIIISNAAGVVRTENVTLVNVSGVMTATLRLDLMDAGEYSVKAIYTEINGTKTTVYEGTGAFTVSKLASEINITDLNATIFVGEDETIILNITLDSGHDGGLISVFVGGIEYTTTISNLTVTVPNLGAGRYDVLIVYHGNEWYNESSATGSFTVNKNVSPIAINVTNSNVGDVEQINVTLPGDAYGFVLLDINGTQYYANMTGGFAQFNITGLKVGKYDINVTYLGNYKYLENKTSSSAVVSKLNTPVVIDVDSIAYGDIANIKVTVNANVTGYITIALNNTMNVTLQIINGAVNWEVMDLAAGNYTVYANYTGSDIFNANDTATATFEVRKQQQPNIVIDHVYVEADQNATITAAIDPRATGNVNITVNGNTYPGVVDHGIIKVTIDKLPVGTYDIGLEYYGDGNYTNRTETLDKGLNVTKITDYAINITALNITVADSTNITVYVPADATGMVFITVDGTTYNKTVTGSAVEFNIPDLHAGIYVVNATLVDSQYVNASAETFFTVSKLMTEINVTADPIYVGDVASITVSLPAGVTENVTIEVAGKKYSKQVNATGQAVFEVEGLIEGVHTVSVTYIGDDKYVFNSTTANITVSKRDASVNITVGDKYEIESVFNITISNATVVNVTINGKEYSVNATTGNVIIDTTKLAAGNYTVVATIYASGEYVGNVTSKTFEIYKHASEITSVVATPEVVIGKNTTITVTMANNKTGKVLIEVNGHNYTVEINDEHKAVLVVALPVGSYNATAYYLGDAKYNETSKKTAFEFKVVDRNATWINIIGVTDIEIENALLFNVTTNSNATLVVNVNGVAAEYVAGNQYRFVGAAAGNYTITAKVDANDYYTDGFNLTRFNVFKHTGVVEIIGVTNGTYEIGSSFTIAGITNSTSMINIIVNGKSYVVANNTVIGLDSTELAAGHYIVTAVINETDKYTRDVASVEFTIAKHTAVIDSINVSSAETIVGNNVTITVAMDNVTAGVVLIEVDGHNYTVEFTNKVAELTVGLPVGDYTAKAYFIENDDYYAAVSDTKDFKVVDKLTPEITITAPDVVKVGETVNITINTNGYNLTVTINDVQQSVIDGKVSFVPAKEGSYTVVATVTENGTVYGGSNFTVFTAVKGRT